MQRTTSPKRWVFFLCVGVLVGINLLIFSRVNSQKIEWRRSYITHFNFFWSTDLDAHHPSALQSSLHAYDFKKIFRLSDLEDGWRVRPLANFVDMVLFKTCQAMKITTFRNDPAIILHLANALLLGILIFWMTQSRLNGLVCFLLFLNSGMAFSTLLLPNRIGKILSMTLFLSAWLIGQRNIYSKPRMWAFYLCLLLMFFTDEPSLLLVPLLFIMFGQQKNHYLLTRKSWSMLWGTLAIGLLLGLLFIWAVLRYGSVHVGLLGDYVKNLPGYWIHTAVVPDTTRSLVWYFLRRHFGYWDGTPWGMLSGLAFITLVFILIKYGTRQAWKNLLIIMAFIVVPTMLFPHPNGVFNYIMGPQTTFPSLLFFGYYYTYVDSVLLVIAIGGLLGRLEDKKILTAIVLSLVTVFSLSNAAHWKQVIIGALKQCDYYATGQRNITKIVGLEKRLSGLKGPVYLSFPSGSHAFFRRDLSSETMIWKKDPLARQERLLPDFIDYASIILPQYLKWIEDGNFIVSLKNVLQAPCYADGQEITHAQFFYDVHRKMLIDLRGFDHNTKVTLSRGVAMQKTVALKNAGSDKTLIFFVRGAARITVKGAKTLSYFQNYGFSYQLFEIPLKKLGASPDGNYTIQIQPLSADPPTAWWAPFWGKSDGHFYSPSNQSVLTSN